MERSGIVRRTKPTSPVPPLCAGGDLPWRILALLALYRLLVPLLLLALAAGPLAPAHPALFRAACLGYLGAAVALGVLERLRRPGAPAQALLCGGVDATTLGLILHAAGAAGGSLGVLLVLPVLGAGGVAGGHRGRALAVYAAACVLVAAVLVEGGAAAGIATSLVLLATGLCAAPLAGRLVGDGPAVRGGLTQPGQLSEYVVQHLREAILVIDSRDRIRLINRAGQQLLGTAGAAADVPLGEVSPRLLHLLKCWRAGETQALGPLCSDPTFASADASRIIRAHFVALPARAPAPVIVFLEDPDLPAQKAQAARLASLARLSASIAHEVRNPVHAMSQAGQLLAEGSGLSEEDRRLTQIIRTNAQRVGEIIDNVLALSRGEGTRVAHLSLARWTEEFRQEFCDTMQWPLSRLAVRGALQPPQVRADPGQLRQIVWNLCENAVQHAQDPAREQPVELAYGRLIPNARPFLEVSDRGPGVAPEHVERIFEPFFSQGSGTGLGLFLARELARTNGATLLYQARPGGGSTFRIVFTDPGRWEPEAA